MKDVYSNIHFCFEEDKKKLQEIWKDDYDKVVEGMCFALASVFIPMLPLIQILMSRGGHVNSHNIQLVIDASIAKEDVGIGVYITPNSSGIKFWTGFHIDVKRPKKLLVKPERKDIPHGMPIEWGNLLLRPLIKQYETEVATSGLPKSIQKRLAELAKIFQHNEPQGVIGRDYYKYPYSDQH